MPPRTPGRWRRSLAGVALFASLAAPAHAAINANKSFAPDVVTANQPSTVTIFFLNANDNVATDVAFTDVLPAGVVIAPTPNTASTCFGTIVANAGDPQVSFSGGSIPAKSGLVPGSCQVSFSVVAASSGVYINTIAAGDVTSTEGANSQPAEATLNVSSLSPIAGTKVFAPTNVHGNGNPSTVTITLNNPNGVALTNLSFVDALPAQIVIAPTPNDSTTCGGTLTANAGATSATLAGGTINAGGSCTVIFNIVAANPNAVVNGNITNTLPAGTITSFEGVTNPLITSNNLLVQTGAQLVKAFSPASIVSGGVSTLTVTVRNYNASPLSPLAFTDALPTGMTIAPGPVLGGTCLALATPASFSVAAAGGTSFTTSGGSLPGVAANAGNTFTSCTFTVQVTSTNASTTPRVLTNGIPAGNFGGVAYSASNNATLTITAPTSVRGSKSFTSPNGPAVQTNWVRATVTIFNDAATEATNVAMTDALTTMGTGYTFGTAQAPTSTCGGAFGATGGTTVSFTGGTIAAGGSCVLTYPVQIAPTAQTGTRTNTIPAGNITATIGGVTVPNTATITAQVAVGAAMGVAKAYAPATVLAGTDTRLTITISHANGAVAFTNLALADTQPASHLISTNPNPATTCAGATVTAVPGSNVVSISGGGLGTGATSCTFSVNVTTPAGAGSATNTINASTATTTQGVTNPSNVTATINRVTGIASLSKSFDPAIVALNGTSTMRVRILNNQTGSVALSGVSLSDALPAGMVIHTTPGASWTGAGCTGGTGVTAPAGGTTVSISGKSIAAGAICTIQVTVVAAAAGNLINEIDATALVTAQGITNIDPVAATLSSIGVADLSVTKDNGLTQIVAGTNVVYTVTASNAAGGANVAGATFTDAVPAGMTFTSWTCTPSGTGTCTAAGSGAINDLVSIPAGQTLVYSITMAVPADATGSITNTATITPPASVVDSDPNNNTASDTDPIVQTIALGISKTDNSLTYTPGGVGTYVMVVSNAGPSNATNLNFGDALPAGVTIRAPGVTCTPAGTASCGSAGANTIGTSTVSFSAMTIAAGAGNELTISIPVDYAPGMTTTPLVNTASIQRGTETPVTANDSSTRAPDIVLDVDKDDGATTFQPGTNGTYTIVVANDGLTTAGDVALADTLPAGVTVRTPGVTCSPTAGSSCGTVTGAAGDATLGTAGAIILPAGELTFTVPVTFGASMSAASITNTATATATDPQLPPPGTVTAQDDDTNTLVLPDLVIDKSHLGNFFQGQVGATFSIVVTNAGNAPTIGAVTVTDTLPAGLTATAVAGTGWTCAAPPTLSCTRSDALAPAASYPAITLTVDVAANAGTPLVNSTAVSGGGEQDTSNNTDTDSVTVDNGPDPTISKTHVGNFFQGQVGAAFTITVTNAGGVATVGTITVSDLLPGGLTATSISGTGWTCAPPGGPCTHPGPLAPAASLPVLTLIVDVAANAGSPLVNQATVSGGGDVNPANNTASDAVTVAAGIDLTIAKSHTGNFVRGQAGTFTIVVSNGGGTASSGTITVTDALPAGLTATAISGAGPDWSCTLATLTCTHPGPLAAGASLPAITLVVSVATNAGSPLVNSTTVSGGGDNDPSNNTATDSVRVVAPPPPPGGIAPIPVHTPAGLALMALLVALAGAGFARARAKR